jgi:drug/metabolite transporter (DMT)-like permease
VARDKTLTTRKRLPRRARHGRPADVRQPAAAVGLGPGPLAAGLAAVILWGLAPVATRAAVGQLAPLPLLILRLSVASLVMLPWAVPVFRRLRPRAAGRLVAAGILGLVGYNLPVTIGLRWLPASTAGLLLATEPVWVMLLGRVFLAERGSARTWLGSAVALSGVAVLAGPGALSGAGGYRGLAGAGLVLASPAAPPGSACCSISSQWSPCSEPRLSSASA